MNTSFEATLAKIIGQRSDLDGRDERAVELGVILPLLKQLGWDTTDMAEIYPQHTLPNGGKPDYDLQIGGESRVLVEVKRWSHPLNGEDEEQLKQYCLAAKPKFAVLTNGSEWRLFLPPARGKSAKLRRFLDFDITTNEPGAVERNFEQFLARDKVASFTQTTQTVKAARGLFEEDRTNAAVMKSLTDAWNKLATDPQIQREFVLRLAESEGVQPNTGQVQKFLSVVAPLVNRVPEATTSKGQKHPKPSSFTIQAPGKETLSREAKDWTAVRVGVCESMLERHPDTFSKLVEDNPGWFVEGNSRWRRQIGETGIYVPSGGYRSQIIKTCVDILAQLGYSEECLSIEERKS